MAVAYSALDSGTERARFAAQLPDGDEPTWNARTNARWAALRGWARGIVAGKVPTPCRGAVDWGGMELPADHARAMRAIKAGRWAVVRCTAPTVNTFFRGLPPRGVIAAAEARGR